MGGGRRKGTKNKRGTQELSSCFPRALMINYTTKNSSQKLHYLQKVTYSYLVAVPAAPASVRKQWEIATYFKGKEDSGRMESM